MPRNSEYDDYEDDEDDEPQAQDQRTDREWADLRRARKAKEKAEAETGALRREIAFMKAGVDTDSPLGALLFKAYDGDLTAEAVKGYAMKAGILKEEAPVDPATTPDAQAAAQQQQQVNALSMGTAPSPTGFDAARLALIEAHQQGGSAGLLAKAAEIGLQVSSPD